MWLAIAAFLGLLTLGAAGVGLDVTAILGPVALVPLVLAALIFARGRSAAVLRTSVIVAVGYVGLGLWNFWRVEEFERLNPGSVDYSGGETAVVFVLLAFAAGLASFGAERIVAGRRRPGGLSPRPGPPGA